GNALPFGDPSRIIQNESAFPCAGHPRAAALRSRSYWLPLRDSRALAGRGSADGVEVAAFVARGGLVAGAVQRAVDCVARQRDHRGGGGGVVLDVGGAVDVADFHGDSGGVVVQGQRSVLVQAGDHHRGGGPGDGDRTRDRVHATRGVVGKRAAQGHHAGGSGHGQAAVLGG